VAGYEITDISEAGAKVLEDVIEVSLLGKPGQRKALTGKPR
jgi:hypothetical protein